MSNTLPKVTSIIEHASHILLRGLPTTATSGDVRRAVVLAGVLGVTDISLIYKRFTPTGQAVLTLTTADLVREALRAARKITFTGREEIGAFVTVDPQFTPQRQRGVKGRVDALNRGLLGSGPSAGFPARRTVTVTGFPGKMLLENFMPYVEGFQLANDRKASVMQAPLPSGVFSMFARFVVVLASESEAQRLHRKLHLTPFRNQTPTRYITSAVLY